MVRIGNFVSSSVIFCANALLTMALQNRNLIPDLQNTCFSYITMTVWAYFFAKFEKTLRSHTFQLTVIRPTEPLRLNLQKFTSDDIGRLIVQGYKAGTDGLKAS